MANVNDLAKLQAYAAKITHSYIARNACGCLRWVCSDDPSDPKWTAREVADAIRRGMAVERVEKASIRGIGWVCEKCRKPADLFTTA